MERLNYDTSALANDIARITGIANDTKTTFDRVEAEVGELNNHFTGDDYKALVQNLEGEMASIRHLLNTYVEKLPEVLTKITSNIESTVEENVSHVNPIEY